MRPSRHVLTLVRDVSRNALGFFGWAPLAIALTMPAACTQSIRATGAGSDVAARVRQALVDGQPLTPDGQYHRAVEVTENTAMQDAKRNWSPRNGRFTFLVHPADKFEGARAVEVSVKPWDERADLERTVEVGVWHWNIFPPFTKGPDPALLDAVSSKLRTQLQAPRAD
jgi:hypothetical protein